MAAAPALRRPGPEALQPRQAARSHRSLLLDLPGLDADRWLLGDEAGAWIA